MSSPYYILACIIVGVMTLFSLGLLFVRAENIERRNFVGAASLATTIIAMTMLWNDARNGQNADPNAAWWAMAVSLSGFFVGRIVDLVLGGRRTAHDVDPTLGSDLSD
jgi:hypothetical protein